ncbi:MAG TPA: TIM barrel protein, partial [Armatimonadota bacterium]|nr:TIM barrel protein [Armatimonadota bacterium]
MNRSSEHPSRRDLLKGAAGTVAALAGLPAASEAQQQNPARGGRPRIGSVSWNFHSFDAGADPTEAIDIIGELGFDGLDLILNAREDIQNLWNDQKIGEYRRHLDRKKLQVAQFVLFQPVVEGLTSTDPEERKRNLDYFEAGCRIGKKLGAPLINIVAPWPRELSRPGGGYLPRYYDLPNPKPGEKFHIEIAPGFDYEKLWADYIATTKACLQRVKAHGMRLSIEHHTHTMIPDENAFLRLWDTIKDPALGCNLDTGWIASHREYPPVAIHALNRRLMNLHVRDIDGLMRSFIHVGEGVMDFKAV